MVTRQNHNIGTLKNISNPLKLENKEKQKHIAKVILIDDSRFDNLINSKLLNVTTFAKQTAIFQDGHSALEFLGEVDHKDDTNFPMFIFLDINMPIMDGFQFLKEFEKLPQATIQNIEIAILTSSINPQDEERADQNKAVSHYIQKPLSVDKITALIESRG